MYEYKVVASDEATALVAIEDPAGRCHLGRALAPAPPPGTALRGAAPGLGLRELQAPAATIPVVLVLLDCDRDAAIKLAGGWLAPAAGSTKRSGPDAVIAVPAS